VNAYGALAVSREVIPAMKTAKSGNIIFIGATASRRGGPKTAAFAPAKAAQRSLAESMARSLWPCGIHVALIVIDGVVDLPRTRKSMPDKPDTFFLKPDEMAASAVWLAQQPRSAWTFEIEVRPFGENW
jgi:NAD(P)-dependent dehydrogenase (short-subunit alcohol dehydrogenase family)